MLLWRGFRPYTASLPRKFGNGGFLEREHGREGEKSCVTVLWFVHQLPMKMMTCWRASAAGTVDARACQRCWNPALNKCSLYSTANYNKYKKETNRLARPGSCQAIKSVGLPSSAHTCSNNCYFTVWPYGALGSLWDLIKFTHTLPLLYETPHTHTLLRGNTICTHASQIYQTGCFFQNDLFYRNGGKISEEK